MAVNYGAADTLLASDINNQKLSQMKDKLTTLRDQEISYRASQNILARLPQDQRDADIATSINDITERMAKLTLEATNLDNQIKAIEHGKTQAVQLLTLYDFPTYEQDAEQALNIENLRLAVKQLTGSETDEDFTETLAKFVQYCQTLKFSENNFRAALEVTLLNEAYKYWQSVREKPIKDAFKLLQERFGTFIRVTTSIKDLENITRKEGQTVYQFMAMVTGLFEKIAFIYPEQQREGRKIATLEHAILSNISSDTKEVIKYLRHKATKMGRDLSLDSIVEAIADREFLAPYKADSSTAFLEMQATTAMHKDWLKKANARRDGQFAKNRGLKFTPGKKELTYIPQVAPRTPLKQIRAAKSPYTRRQSDSGTMDTSGSDFQAQNLGWLDKSPPTPVSARQAPNNQLVPKISQPLRTYATPPNNYVSSVKPWSRFNATNNPWNSTKFKSSDNYAPNNNSQLPWEYKRPWNALPRNSSGYASRQNRPYGKNFAQWQDNFPYGRSYKPQQSYGQNRQNQLRFRNAGYNTRNLQKIFHYVNHKFTLPLCKHPKCRFSDPHYVIQCPHFQRRVLSNALTLDESDSDDTGLDQLDSEQSNIILDPRDSL